LLNKGNKLKLPEVRRPDEVAHINDPNYYLFHRIVHHPTSRCFIFKDKIQALVDAGVLMLGSERKVTTNMMTLIFENFLKVSVQDGLTPIPEGRLKVTNPLAAEGYGPRSIDNQIWRSCGYTQILSMMSNESQLDPSSRENHAMSSLLHRKTK